MIISQLGREKNRFLDIDKLIQCYLDKILLQHNAVIYPHRIRFISLKEA